MFDLEPTDEQIVVIETVAALARDHLRLQARGAEDRRAVPAEIARAVHDLGVFDPVPEAAGGGGVPDPVTHLMAVEELAYGDANLAFAVTFSGLASLLVGRLGSTEQQHSLLGPFRDGPAQGSVFLYEGYGRRPSELLASATPTESGWRLQGEKVAVVGPASASLSVVLARRSDTGHLAAFAVPGALPHTLVRDDSEVGAVGLLPARTAKVSLDVEVGPAAWLDAPPEEIARAVAQVRLTHAAVCVGCGRAANEYAADYATQRVAFGKPISSFQGIAFIVAESEMEIDLCRLDLWRVAASLDLARDPVAIERDVNRVVTTAGETVLRATRTGVQVLGGHGFLTDHPVERWYRSATALGALDFDPLDVPVAITEKVCE